MNWTKYLPATIRGKIEHRPNLLKILINAGWLFFDRILRMGMGLVVGVWVARYLGADQFGLLNYAYAIVALFSAIATLGLNNIVVRDIVNHSAEEKNTLGTAFFLQLIGGFLGFFLATVTVWFLRPDDSNVLSTVAIIAFSLVFKSTDVVRYWFEAKVQSKYVVWVENIAFVVFSLVKVFLILSGAPFIYFVWVVFAESFMVAALLLMVYASKNNSPFNWRFHYVRAKSLLLDSWPLILSGLATMLYMRIDQVMLGQMLGDKSVGLYSAAARISEVWYFIPMALVSSVFPGIVKLKKDNEGLYFSRLQKLYDFLIPLAIFVAVVISFFSGFIMEKLYGGGYSGAESILSIQVWAGVFVTMGVARGPWVIAEGLQRYTYRYIGIAMVVNIVGNSLLIPMYGPTGAAISSIMAQATTAMVAPCLFKETRVSVRMFLKSINIFKRFI